MESFIADKINNLESSIGDLLLNKKEKIKEYIECFFNTDNIGVEYYILKNLINLGEQNISVILYLIEITLQFGDYKQAKEYISLLSDEKNKAIIHLQNKIDEVNSDKDMYLNSSRKKMYIMDKFNLGEYERAFFECDEYYENTKDKDFIFIKAKLLYLLSIYEEAINLFIKYISIGNKFFLEANIYLFYIFNKLNLQDTARLYSTEVHELLYNSDEIDISKFENLLLDLEKDFNSNTLLRFKKSMLFNSSNFENCKQYINKIY